MKKSTLLLAAVVITAISVGTLSVYADEDLLAKITQLEKQNSDKDAIIMEQVKVILLIKDNYKATYDTFNPVKYQTTGGYPTDWLEGERNLIKQNCAEAEADGYFGNNYCRYVK